MSVDCKGRTDRRNTSFVQTWTHPLGSAYYLTVLLAFNDCMCVYLQALSFFLNNNSIWDWTCWIPGRTNATEYFFSSLLCKLWYLTPLEHIFIILKQKQAENQHYCWILRLVALQANNFLSGGGNCQLIWKGLIISPLFEMPLCFACPVSAEEEAIKWQTCVFVPFQKSLTSPRHRLLL